MCCVLLASIKAVKKKKTHVRVRVPARAYRVEPEEVLEQVECLRGRMGIHVGKRARHRRRDVLEHGSRVAANTHTHQSKKKHTIKQCVAGGGKGVLCAQ